MQGQRQYSEFFGKQDFRNKRPKGVSDDDWRRAGVDKNGWLWLPRAMKGQWQRQDAKANDQKEK